MEKSNIKETYNALIKTEINNIYAKPLGYSGAKLLETLDEFELDYRVRKHSHFLLRTIAQHPRL